MTKEFIQYTEALELKELGFDEPCVYYTDKDNNSYIYNFQTHPDEFIEGCGVNVIPTPTFSHGFRFFREKHNLMFQIFYLRNGNYAVLIHRTTPEYMDLVDQIKPSSGCVAEVVDCYSYEEAELECLLKLIKIVKQQKQ
jgi:hypothetical protein